MVLFIVLATVLVVIILAGVVLMVISSQSRLTNHQISRIKAYYAGRGIMNYVLEKLQKGDPLWAPGSGVKHACFAVKGCIDAVGNNAPIPDDPDIPYKIQVTIYPINAALGNTVTQFDVKTDYTYTP